MEICYHKKKILIKTKEKEEDRAVLLPYNVRTWSGQYSCIYTRMSLTASYRHFLPSMRLICLKQKNPYMSFLAVLELCSCILMYPILISSYWFIISSIYIANLYNISCIWKRYIHNRIHALACIIIICTIYSYILLYS